MSSAFTIAWPPTMARHSIWSTALYFARRFIQPARRVTCLLLTIHHIAADGWSLMQLLEELRALYAEATGGPVVSTQRPPVDYSQFTRWQAEMLAGEEGKRVADYWRTQMASPRAEVELPADRPRLPSTRSSRGGTFPVAPLRDDQRTPAADGEG